MNILFISIGGLADLSETAVYPDLLRHFRDEGHSVYVICQREKRTGFPTQLKNEHGIQVLRVRTGNITKVGLFEKGISTLCIGSIFINAIRTYYSDVKFDIILYSTPPITVASTVRYLKKRDNSFTYLMLKDIFPQNAVDIGILCRKGVKRFIYQYFRSKEKALYKISDHIGCMSDANIKFLIKHNPQLIDKVGLCPNTINPLPTTSYIDKSAYREKFSLPIDKTIFIYGGNFGKPQDVDFIIKVLQSIEHRTECHFVMCGSGTDFYKIKEYYNEHNNANLTVLDTKNTKEYGELLEACDVGLIFLDHRFTVPNFPSRILDYLNHNIPVFASTDDNTDVGEAIITGNFGWWCKSDSLSQYVATLNIILKDHQLVKEKGIRGKEFLRVHYDTKIAYNEIMAAYRHRIHE